MAEKYNKILHKRSVQSGATELTPKLPDASILEYGEIAINYGKGHEAISFKNNNEEVVSFRTDEFYQNNFENICNKVDTLSKDSTHLEYPTAKAVYDVILDNEEVTAAALNNLNTRITSLENNTNTGGVDEKAVTTIVQNVIDDLDATVESTNGSFVNVKVEQVNGTISNITVSENNLVSTTALTQETNSRISGDTTLQNQIDVLKGDGEGSINKKITDAFDDFTSKLSDDNVVNTYKELIDYAATHGPEFTELVGIVTDLETVVEENENVVVRALTNLDERLKVVANGIVSEEEKTKLNSIIIENGKVINVDALTDNNLGHTETDNTFAVVKDTDGKLFVNIKEDVFESLNNKVTVLNENSTDQQYPSAKVVYNSIIETEYVISTVLNELYDKVDALEARLVALENNSGNTGGGTNPDYEARIAELERKLAAIIVEE